ncbi:hypothetical protein ROHU_004018 [Labeo rohita]|uniref:Uncharacterized protein n=1 Tax=Labeo rohita TaxID=84645 RepID=A0A498NS87_LABRO|nr:hypothetical protein ROHU_004018 [Labeo rohita]
MPAFSKRAPALLRSLPERDEYAFYGQQLTRPSLVAPVRFPVRESCLLDCEVKLCKNGGRVKKNLLRAGAEPAT